MLNRDDVGRRHCGGCRIGDVLRGLGGGRSESELQDDLDSRTGSSLYVYLKLGSGVKTFENDSISSSFGDEVPGQHLEQSVQAQLRSTYCTYLEGISSDDVFRRHVDGFDDDST
jgi:hypothetical protein